MSSSEPETTLAFAGYRLHTRKRRLVGVDGRPIGLSSRAFDTLHYLASHPHELVEKQRLMQAVWPNAVVEENNLSQQISTLRKVLGDAADDPRFIVTDARRGFRFIQDVQRIGSPAPDEVERTEGTARAPVSSEAAPSVVFNGPAGSTAHKVSCEPGPAVPHAAVGATAHKWSTPRRGVAIMMVGALMLIICAALYAALAGREPVRTVPSMAGGTHDLEAYQAYLSARAVTNTVGFSEARDAIRLLERAVKIDPSFALAWAALAQAYSFAADFPASLALPLAPEELQHRMSRAALRALELAPDAPQSLLAAGMVSMRNRDWMDAQRRLRRAVELAGPYDYESNFLYAWFLMNVGRVTDAIPFLDRAMHAEPLLLRPVTLRAALHEMRGEVDEAEALVLGSNNLRGEEILRRQELIMVCLARGDTGSGLIRTAVTKEGGARSCASPTLTQLRDRYDETVRNGGTPGQLLPVVLLAPHFGDLALSMKALRALGPITQNLFAIWRPALRDVRRLPDFQSFLRDIGLLHYWRTSGNWGDFCHQTAGEGLTCR